MLIVYCGSIFEENKNILGRNEDLRINLQSNYSESSQSRMKKSKSVAFI